VNYLDIPKRTRVRCTKAAASIDKIGDADMESTATAVMSALRGDSVVFQILDERPSWFFAKDGHASLRSVRNHPTHGQKLFASFRR